MYDGHHSEDSLFASSNVQRIDHAPYIRTVYTAAAAHPRLRLGTPEINSDAVTRSAHIELHSSISGRWDGRLTSAALEWDDRQGWRILATTQDGPLTTFTYPGGVVPFPSALLKWAAGQLKRGPEPAGQSSPDELFTFQESPGYIAVDPEHVEQELATYANYRPGQADASVTVSTPLAAPPTDKPKPLNVAVTDITNVMRDHLMNNAERFKGLGYVGEFSILRGTWAKGDRLCVFIDRDSDDRRSRVAGLGIACTSGNAGDYEKRLTISHFVAVSSLISVTELKQQLGRYGDALDENGHLSHARGRRLLDALASKSDDLANCIDELKELLNVEHPSTEDRPVRPYEKDAVGVLFEAFDIDREILLDWRPSPDSKNFLDELPHHDISPQERQLIAYDKDIFLGWFSERTDSLAWGLFRNRYKTRSLLVANVDSSPTEAKAGVDLIYYNPKENSFVMLQYKMLKPSGDGLVSSVDERFLDQVERMREVDEAFADSTPGHPEIRLVDTPCFVKLCEPQTRMVNSTDLIRGMYLSREHFEIVHSSPEAVGPNGGKRVGPQVARRYLTNTEFSFLLANGWIGSRGTGTDKLSEELRRTLNAGRSLVFGVHLDGMGRTNFSDGIPR
ncbi:hypothetical protein GCM10009799_29990 [Nocardiopsis rhodophaea]|uniref:DUF6292 domain-containing protein n=1 Tax=Nocardiopsis rhodophaea TaxID=280238 RepID=A0ABN2T7A2_9ACTN